MATTVLSLGWKAMAINVICQNAFVLERLASSV